MLTIRDEQVQILTAPILDGFRQRAASHLIRFFPDECEVLGGSELSDAVDYGLERARSHGLVSENHVTKYLNLMFTFGRDFDTNPDFPWAQNLLSLGCLTSEKMDRLIKRALGEADRGDGFLAEHARSPSEPTLGLKQRPFESADPQRWIALMAGLVSWYCRNTPWYRWDDTNDLTGVDHLEGIAEVARITPEIRHWLPTRAYDEVRAFLGANPEGFPWNLTVRIGAPRESAPAPRIATLTTSTIERWAPATESRCPAKTSAGRCVDCRICWDPATANVAFHPWRWRPGLRRSVA